MCHRIELPSFAETKRAAQHIAGQLALPLFGDHTEAKGMAGFVLRSEDSAEDTSGHEEAWPNSTVLLINVRDGSISVDPLTWGFTVEWQRMPLVNARLDTALGERSLWHDALLHRRCIVPAQAFYESHASETVRSAKTGRPVKRQYRFAMANVGEDCTSQPTPLAFLAGIHEDGRFALVTVEPNATVAPVHDRMPLALTPEEAARWLNPLTHLEELASLADRSELSLVAQAEAEPPCRPRPTGRSRSAPSEGQLSLF